MTIFVGSTNPVKINAVKLSAIDHWSDLTIQGFATKSGVPEQPITDEQTKNGSINRAKSALAQGMKLESTNISRGPILGFGLEGGVFTEKDGSMWTTVWVTLVENGGRQFEVNGARVKVPELIAKMIRNGEEMGPVMQQLTGHTNVKQKQGMFGVITNNYVDRTEEYSTIAKMALGLWYGRDWDAQLRLTTKS